MRIDTASFVLADIPGLIEGASEGTGLGDRFLGHIERCAVLLHLVDGTEDDPAASYNTIRGELEVYGNGLDTKRELVALTKVDALQPAELEQKFWDLANACGQKPLKLSAATHTGVDEAMAGLLQAIEQGRADATREKEEAKVAASGWQP